MPQLVLYYCNSNILLPYLVFTSRLLRKLFKSVLCDTRKNAKQRTFVKSVIRSLCNFQAISDTLSWFQCFVYSQGIQPNCIVHCSGVSFHLWRANIIHFSVTSPLTPRWTSLVPRCASNLTTVQGRHLHHAYTSRLRQTTPYGWHLVNGDTSLFWLFTTDSSKAR